MTLDGLQRLLHDHFHYNAAQRDGGQVNIVRFADDFIVSGARKRLLRDEAQPLLAHFLDKRGMRFSTSKTRITSIKQGVVFLGFFVQKTAFGQVRITPTEKRIKALLESIAAVLHDLPQAAPGTIIARLNPIIRGWTTYYDHCDSRNAFDRLDDAVYDLLLGWARPRHPGYFNRKAVTQYFLPVKGQSPCFRDQKQQKLFRAHDVPLRTHIPIDPEYNPYDPKWDRDMARRKQQRKQHKATRKKEE